MGEKQAVPVQQKILNHSVLDENIRNVLRYRRNQFLLHLLVFRRQKIFGGAVEIIRGNIEHFGEFFDKRQRRKAFFYLDLPDVRRFCVAKLGEFFLREMAFFAKSF